MVVTMTKIERFVALTLPRSLAMGNILIMNESAVVGSKRVQSANGDLSQHAR